MGKSFVVFNDDQKIEEVEITAESFDRLTMLLKRGEKPGIVINSDCVKPGYKSKVTDYEFEMTDNEIKISNPTFQVATQGDLL